MKKSLLQYSRNIYSFIYSMGVYVFFQVKGKEEYNTILTIEKNQPLMKSLAPLPNSDSFIFKLYLRFRNGGRGIKAGQYHIEGSYSLEELINILESGKGRMVKVTIPEGFSVKQIVEHLEEIGHIDRDEFYAELNKAAETFPYPTPNGNFEGYLYPETYFLPEKI